MSIFINCSSFSDEDEDGDCRRGATVIFTVAYVSDEDGRVRVHALPRCDGHRHDTQENLEGMGEKVLAVTPHEPCCLGGRTTGNHSAFCSREA